MTAYLFFACLSRSERCQKAAHLRDSNDASEFWRLHRPRLRPLVNMKAGNTTLTTIGALDLALISDQF
jgi:hypothetical protein